MIERLINPYYVSPLSKVDRHDPGMGSGPDLSTRMSTTPWSSEFLGTGKVTLSETLERFKLEEDLRQMNFNDARNEDEANSKAKHLKDYDMFTDQMYFMY